jgi:hypothetical protein
MDIDGVAGERVRNQYTPTPAHTIARRTKNTGVPTGSSLPSDEKSVARLRAPGVDGANRR